MSLAALRRSGAAPRWLALFGLALSCASWPSIDVDVDVSSADLPHDAGNEFPLAPQRLDALLSAGALRIVSLEPLDDGVTGAFRARFEAPTVGEAFDAKWKPSPPGDADGWNNSPRKEIAAFEIQKWFLSPADWVVPPTAGICLPLDHYRTLDPSADANLPEASCMFGTVSVWLEDVEVPEEVFDEELFRTDPSYAYHFAHFNLLSHLIDHRDARSGNVLVSADDDSERRVFSVDNGVAFGPRLYNFFVLNWDELRVSALPTATVERLRKVSDEQLAGLAAVAQFERRPDGLYRPIDAEPPEPPCGACLEDSTLTLGLTADEIQALRERVSGLLAAVDDGQIDVF